MFGITRHREMRELRIEKKYIMSTIVWINDWLRSDPRIKKKKKKLIMSHLHFPVKELHYMKSLKQRNRRFVEGQAGECKWNRAGLSSEMFWVSQPNRLIIDQPHAEADSGLISQLKLIRLPMDVFMFPNFCGFYF